MTSESSCVTAAFEKAYMRLSLAVKRVTWAFETDT
jgi:hypothetical protein